MEVNLSTRHDTQLTPEQRKSLEEHLSKLRMGRLRVNAQDMSVYLEEATLGIPVFDTTKANPDVDVLFAWQWRYWVMADTLGAIGEINNGQSVLTSPIKRVVSVSIAELPIIPGDVFDGTDNRGSGSSDPLDDGSDWGESGGGGGSGSGRPNGRTDGRSNGWSYGRPNWRRFW